MTEKQILKQEQKWAVQKDLLERKQKIDKEKAEFQAEKKRLTTTKKLVVFLFLNCTIIEIFTGVITLMSVQSSVYTGMAPDMTPLVTLIGAVVGEVIGFAVYSAKSAKENSVNGITYAKMMMENGYSDFNEVEGATDDELVG